MSVADDQIRVSATVKRQLDRQKRPGESYNDVLERLLDDTPAGNFATGFGLLADTQADRLREQRATAKQRRKERQQRLAGESE
jgi:predicted CopG family antitoxin